MICPECGSKSRHRRGCSQKLVKLSAVEKARNWFDTFRYNRNVISDNGAIYFKALLDEIDRLKAVK